MQNMSRFSLGCFHKMPRLTIPIPPIEIDISDLVSGNIKVIHTDTVTTHYGDMSCYRKKKPRTAFGQAFSGRPEVPPTACWSGAHCKKSFSECKRYHPVPCWFGDKCKYKSLYCRFMHPDSETVRASWFCSDTKPLRPVQKSRTRFSTPNLGTVDEETTYTPIMIRPILREIPQHSEKRSDTRYNRKTSREGDNMGSKSQNSNRSRYKPLNGDNSLLQL